MRRVLLVLFVVAAAAVSTGVSFAEVVTGCEAQSWLWPSDAGEASPAAAVEAASDLEAPSSLPEGTTELRDNVLATVEKTDGGYVLAGTVSCQTTSVVTLGWGASAHTAGTFYDPDGTIAGLETWPGASPSVAVHFTVGMPDAARTAARRGFTTWETETDTIDYSVGAEHGNSVVDWGNCATYDDEVHWNEEVGGGSIARAGVCWTGSGNLYTFVMAFDDDVTWHTGTGTPPASEFDVESVAAHEWGHVTGFGLTAPHHFTDVDCGSATRATMCSAINPGTDVWRTLNAHDIHTSEAAYD